MSRQLHAATWPKGISQNPGGKVSGTWLRRQLKGSREEILAKLMELLRCGEHRVELEAVKVCLDRLYGKPEVAVAVTHQVERPLANVPAETILELAAKWSQTEQN